MSGVGKAVGLSSKPRGLGPEGGSVQTSGRALQGVPSTDPAGVSSVSDLLRARAGGHRRFLSREQVWEGLGACWGAGGGELLKQTTALPVPLAFSRPLDPSGGGADRVCGEKYITG